MAPKKVTVYPIVSRAVKEKDRQNKRKGHEGLPFFLNSSNKTKQNKRMLISVEAARDNKCFTSEGYGLIRDRLMASGRLFKKLPTVGFNSVTATGEPPFSFIKLCCLFTTDCGKFNLGLKYFKEKKAIANNK